MPVDDATFRELMSAFPSGVAIVTAVGNDGAAKGLTTRSFVSVAAAPPTILVSVDRSSRTLVAIRESRALVVNFLLGGRQDLSDLFASKAEDKFARVSWEPSKIAHGAPILTGDSVAWAECVVTGLVEAGDHHLILATVEGGRFIGGRPLLYYRRIYAEWPGA